MIEAKHIDRRHTQTREQYAADDLETMQAARRYSAHLFNLFRPHIGKRVLEVGSGIGTMSRPLADVADLVIGIEPNANCVTRCEAVMRDQPRFSLRVCHLEECDRDELLSHRLDTIVCVNVLEHIEDDAGALRTFKDVLVPGGRALIFVPAVQAAYGPLDAELGHHRRYSKPSLARASHIRKARVHSLTQVKIFDALVAPWALPIEHVVAPPIGLSLVAVGRKPSR
jgi:2-polyprenyl-3-methyl-5-hydroxy-6-metoxy-1,4-benzoquinol methylase